MTTPHAGLMIFLMGMAFAHLVLNSSSGSRQMEVATEYKTPVPADTSSPTAAPVAASPILVDNQDSAKATLNLLGPNSHGEGCPATCGCPHSPQDCPQWYTAQDVMASASESKTAHILEAVQTLGEARLRAVAACSTDVDVQSNGGWCLTPRQNGQVQWADGTVYPLAMHHVGPSQRILMELTKLVRDEKVTSLNDFGAGIGQYGAALSSEAPDLHYRGYDGAGNIEEYTHGKIHHFDLTMPLFLPVADWVLSLEVGEHVPSQFEGRVLRNFHRHNRKGIILSWGVLGQNGNHHINLHSNDYLIRVMGELGYTHDHELSQKFRNPANNKFWFESSLMVFRRNQPL